MSAAIFGALGSLPPINEDIDSGDENDHARPMDRFAQAGMQQMMRIIESSTEQIRASKQAAALVARCANAPSTLYRHSRWKNA